MRLIDILNRSFSTLIKEINKDIKDSKHSPVYRKRGVEGFSPLFCFFFVNLNKMERKMKLSVKVLVILLGIAIFPQASHAQVKAIITYADFDEDNAVAGDTTNIQIFAKFVSAVTNADTTVNGNIFFRYKTNWSIDWNPGWIGSFDDTVVGTQSLGIGLQQFYGKFYCETDTNILRTGPVNVIIIWPAFYGGPGNPLVDSADYFLSNVNIYPEIGFYEEPVSKFGSTVFPNPSSSMELVFLNSKYTQPIHQICIMNAVGQTLFIKEFDTDTQSNGYVLPTTDLRAGIYHIHIFYKDKKSEVVKFVKN